MKCEWDELLHLLPVWMRSHIDSLSKNSLQELRLRIGYPIELVCQDGKQYLSRCAGNDDISYVINAASQYSPWTTQSASQGFITATGGHRVGICGETILHNGELKGIKSHTSVCIRVARDFENITGQFVFDDSSILIIGAPGRGKTTLLRDLIRRYSSHGFGSIAVLDERGEIFPTVNGKICFTCGSHTDILSNCPKTVGIQILLRAMGPSCIAVDEITRYEDCAALIDANGCGVKLIATAHAGNLADLKTRLIYRSLLEAGVFQRIIVMQQDKSWREERI